MRIRFAGKALLAVAAAASLAAPPAWAATITVTPTTLPAATVGSAYSTALKASGGTAPYTFALGTGSSAPAGLTLSSAGVLAGTPTTASAAAGDTFTVDVEDSSKTKLTATVKVTLVVDASAISVTPLALTGATAGKPYTATFTAKGGKAPYAWSLVGGSSWDGLTLSGAGVLAGTPLQPTAGTLNASFELEVTDASSPKKGDFATVAIAIAPAALSVPVTTLAPAIVGDAYSAVLTAAGGIAPYTWSIAAGSSAPSGLKLSSAGALTGTPTTASGASPTSFAVAVKDSETPAKSIDATIFLQIDAPPARLSIGSLVLPPAYLDTAFSTQLNASGGVPPYTWSLPSGSQLPAGLALASNGVISGKPTVLTNLDTFPVKLTDSDKPAKSLTASIDAYVYPAVAQCSGGGAQNALLKGRYSFELQTIVLGPAGRQWTVGAFTADGKGNLTAGIFDSNGPNFSVADLGTFSGTYSIGANGTGMLTVKIPQPAGTPAETRAFCLSLDSVSSGVAGSGRMVADDESGFDAAGQIYLQPATALTVPSMEGSWVFGVEGSKIPDGGGTPTRHAAAGYVVLNSTGQIEKGEIDINDTQYNSSGDLVDNYAAQIPLTGSFTLASTGRGTMAVSNPSGTIHFVYYVTAANGLLVISTDPGISETGNNPVFVGEAVERTASTFNDGTLSASSVLIARGNAIEQGVPAGRAVELGILNWNGGGKFTGSADENSAGNVTLATDNPLSGTYAVDAQGRAAITPTKGNLVYLYLAGPGEGIGISDDLGATYIKVEKQTPEAGGFTLPSIDGVFSQGVAGYSSEQEAAEAGQITSNGDGGISGLEASNLAGDVTLSTTTGVKYTGGTNGRFLETFPPKTTPSNALYEVSPKTILSINIDGDPWELILVDTHQ